MSRVLLVVGPATGGMGRHVASLSERLGTAGFEVTVLTSPRTAERFDLGGDVVRDWRPGARGLPATLRRLRGLIAALDPATDVVHAHGHQAGLVTVLAARTLRRRPRVVVSWHNAVLVEGPRARVLALAEAVQARGADLLTGASEDLVDRARHLGARRPELAEVAAAGDHGEHAAGDHGEHAAEDHGEHAAGGRDGADRRPRIANLSGDGASPVVLTVSRIAPQKRLDVVVEAAAALARRFPGLRWQVAGDGDEALLAGLVAQAERCGAPVEFLGARSDVPALMAAADVFALSSAWEARALVVQEAMACGLPVVATDSGGLPGLLAGSGVLVPVGDAGALADAVAGLLSDPERAAGRAEAGRRRYAELPTEADVAAAWADRYRLLV